MGADATHEALGAGQDDGGGNKKGAMPMSSRRAMAPGRHYNAWCSGPDGPPGPDIIMIGENPRYGNRGIADRVRPHGPSGPEHHAL